MRVNVGSAGLIPQIITEAVFKKPVYADQPLGPQDGEAWRKQRVVTRCSALQQTQTNQVGP